MAGVCMTEDIISDALDRLRGALMIVYPMNLPPYDPIRLEFEGNEDLSGTQVGKLSFCLRLFQEIGFHGNVKSVNIAMR